MKTKYIYIMLMLVLVIGIFVIPQCVNAETYTDASGNDYRYEISNNEATITGFSGGGDITIPSTIDGYAVTSIGEYAFWGCDGLTSVITPDTMTSIGESAFRDCDELTSVIMPDGMTSIGEYAFYECAELNSVKIPDSVMTIGSWAFLECTGLTSMTIPNGVTSINDYTFPGCSGLTSVTIHDGVVSIGEGAFSGCTGLTSITIPDSVTSIGEYAFDSCTGLTSVMIFDGVTDIGYGAFCDCTSLTSVIVPDSVTNICDFAFFGCSSLEEITLPFIGSQRGNSGTENAVFGYIFGYTDEAVDEAIMYTVKQYYSSASYHYYFIPDSLKRVTITDETMVGYGAFYGCSNLTDIVIKGGVKDISSRAFAYHNNFLSIVIISKDARIGNNAVHNADFATLYGYSGSTIEQYSNDNNIDFKPLADIGNCELDGKADCLNEKIVVDANMSKYVSGKNLNVVIYDENDILLDYIIVTSNTPYNNMNVVFKDNPNAKYAKIFLWDELTQVVPLADAKKVDIVR